MNFTEPPWVAEARKDLGVREIKGPAHEARILQMWRDAKLSGIKSELVPWCAGAACAWLERSGHRSPRADSAASFLTWGRKLDHPEVGCITIFSRPGGNHVAFTLARDAGGDLVCIGGNQADSVSIATFARTRVIGHRWPSTHPIPEAGALPPYTAAVGRSTKEA